MLEKVTGHYLEGGTFRTSGRPSCLLAPIRSTEQLDGRALSPRQSNHSV
jgi:hypothetical protein